MLKRKDIEHIKAVSKIVADILQIMKKEVRSGICGKELEKIASKIMKEKKVKSSILDYKGFPAAICISVNNQLTHGIPDERLFKRGDLVSFDVACNYKGIHADAALTVIVDENQEEDNEKKKLLTITEEALNYAIENIKPNITTVSEVGKNIENYVRKKGFWVIKDLGGHRIGSLMHLDPFIPNYDNEDKTIIKINNAYCIEPLVQRENTPTKLSDDGWTVTTGSLNAHFEDTILITAKGVENLTRIKKENE